uniref:Coiled-coil domain-containing protein 25 n=1 Tax=Callorhinchus milii TaxID=7868 RepID=A0A4W3IZ15_CALMI
PTYYGGINISLVVSPSYTIYMGKDKYESKFHVDKLSSAHVYLRLHKGQTIDDLPKEVLIDCAQLVKANSIQGSKMNNINIVYTPWSNLKKTGDMDIGQIGFHRQKDVKIIAVEKKINEMLNRLEKTKDERFPDLAAEKESREREERNEKKAQMQEMKRREKDEMKKKTEMEELRSYSSLMKSENMSTNQVWKFCCWCDYICHIKCLNTLVSCDLMQPDGKCTYMDRSFRAIQCSW